MTPEARSRLSDTGAAPMGIAKSIRRATPHWRRIDSGISGGNSALGEEESRCVFRSPSSYLCSVSRWPAALKARRDHKGLRPTRSCGPSGRRRWPNRSAGPTWSTWSTWPGRCRRQHRPRGPSGSARACRPCWHDKPARTLPARVAIPSANSS
jgi:hypothetical protein